MATLREPPDELTEEQAEEWRAVVGAVPRELRGRETQGMLVAYCRHLTRARFLSRAVDEFDFEQLKEGDGIDRYDKVSKAAERETRCMLACARSLRITPQSWVDPQKAGRRYDSGMKMDLPPGWRKPRNSSNKHKD